MNDEYLWNKIGKDPEIEKLEKALAVFRYRETTMPAAAPQMEMAPERPRRFRLSLAFAFASFAIVAILAGAWFRTSNLNSTSENADELVFVQSTDVPDPSPVVEPISPPVRDPNRLERPVGNRRRTIIRTNASLHHRPRTKDLAPRDGVAALTADERFAYRQLMLALSITSSKLKIVQDTIDGTGAAENIDSKNQR